MRFRGADALLTAGKRVLLLALCLGCYRPNPDEAARPLRVKRVTPAPVFPWPLHAANAEGEVQLLLPIDAAGRPDTVHMRVRGDPHRLFRSAVVTAVSQWRFAPARRGGYAVADSLTLRWRFVLDQSGCPPRVRPPPPCVAPISDTAALRAPQHSTFESSSPGRLEGKTVACPVPAEWVRCLKDG